MEKEEEYVALVLKYHIHGKHKNPKEEYYTSALLKNGKWKDFKITITENDDVWKDPPPEIFEKPVTWKEFMETAGVSIYVAVKGIYAKKRGLRAASCRFMFWPGPDDWAIPFIPKEYWETANWKQIKKVMRQQPEKKEEEMKGDLQ